MNLHPIDIAIIVAYLATSVLVGYWVSHRASRDMKAYFLGGNVMPWYVLGISNASGMFDISGTMLLVYWMFVYGLKSVWIPWMWPTFNQVFLMVFLSAWLRRSNVMTGAEWIQTRFGKGRGAHLAHIIVVVYAFVSIIGFFSYGFKGIGKFAANFLPWDLTPNQYALILIAITTIYVVKGGMFSVVVTEVLQFCILSIASFAVGIIAMMKVAPDALAKVVPAGWDNLFFGWHLNLDWSKLIPAATDKIAADGYGLFGFLVMAFFFKGMLISAAGPAPNYDMQRVLSCKNPREASMMSGWVNVVLTFPRYFLITGLTILALVFYSDHIRSMGTGMDFEAVLPLALGKFVPAGLLGFLIAGLLAAYMSNFAATVNAAPPYFVNDIYKRFINPHADPKTYVRLSYLSSFLVVVVGVLIGWYVASVNSVVIWIVSGLWGGYTASNVLKWYWWRFNGYGYFWGMVAGITASLTVPAILNRIPALQAYAQAHELNLEVSVGFTVVFVISLIGCLVGTLLTKAEDDEVLKDFYRRVRPWGFWGPILKQVQREDPSFQRNKDFPRDMFNVAVGVCWQVTLVALPIYIVIQKYTSAAVALAIVAVTSVILKFTWYDHLRELTCAKLGPESGDTMVFERFDTKSPSEAVEVLFTQAVPSLQVITTADIRSICSKQLNYDFRAGQRHVVGTADHLRRIVAWNLEQVPQQLYSGQRVIGFQVMIQPQLHFAGLTIFVGDASGTPGYAFGARVWRTTDQLFVQGWEGFLTSPPAFPTS